MDNLFQHFTHQLQAVIKTHIRTMGIPRPDSGIQNQDVRDGPMKRMKKLPEARGFIKDGIKLAQASPAADLIRGSVPKNLPILSTQSSCTLREEIAVVYFLRMYRVVLAGEINRGVKNV